jgi:hypothetical protein
MAVKQTPLTETLSPIFISGNSFEQATLSRRFSPATLISSACPTSSMIPVNMAV